MKNAVRKALKISGIVAGALAFLALAAALLVIFDKPLVRKIIRSQLGKAAGTTARFAGLDYSLFPFRVTVDSLVLVQENPFQKLELSLKRLEAGGKLWKLVRGVKPALDALEIDGASLRLKQKARSEEPFDIEALLVQAADALAWARRISLTDARLSVSLLSLGADIEDLDLTLEPGTTGDVLAFTIGSSGISLEDKTGAFGLTSGLSSSGTLRLISPFMIDARFAFHAARVSSGGIEDSLDALTIAIAGRFDASASDFAVSRLEIGVPGLLDLKGTAAGRFGHSVFVDTEATARIESLERAAAILGPRLPKALRGAKVKGQIELAGKYGFHRTAQESNDNIDAALSLQGIEIDHVAGGLPLRVRADGRIAAAGPTRDPRFSADVRSTVGNIAVSGIAAAGSNLHVVVEGTRASVAVSRLDARLAGLVYAAAGDKRISFDTALLSAKGSLDLTRKSATLTSLDAGLAGLVYAAAEDKRISFDTALLSAKGSLDLTRKSAALTSLDAGLAGLVYAAAEDKRISFDTASLSVKGSLDLARKSVALTSLEARLPGLAPLRLSGGLGFGKSHAARLELEIRGLDVAALRAIAAPFVPAGFSGWELAAMADLSLSYRRGASPGDWGASGTLSLAGATFNDPSFTIASEGLEPSLRFKAAPAAAPGLSFTASIDIGRGESLWKDLYVSWSKYPLALSLSGRYDPASGAVDGLAARAFLPGIGAIDAAGTARLALAPAFDLSAKADLSLGPLYSLYTQTGVSAERRLKLEGKLGADVRLIKTGDALSVAGRVRLAEAGLENPVTKTLLAGLSADLPVHYESAPGPADGPDAPLPDEGYLRIRELSNKFLSLSSLDFPLRAGTNALGLEPVTLELFGGRLELGRTVFRYDPATGSFRGVGSLALGDVDIARFPIASPQFKLTGKIRAEFPRLDIGTDLIGVSGRGEAEVFGGKIVLRDLAVSDPFTPGRSISLNVDLLEVDLKKLTDEVPFGEVTGIVSGEIRDLVLTYNQPARFDFRLESVPRKGVARTFSLKAVDNLTVLSSGQQASAGTGGFWMRFIRGFRYQKLGIVSTLRNDTFTLNGTIHEGGLEYLVKKPALFGISVVNREPGKVISFKEMTGRLKRVGQSER